MRLVNIGFGNLVNEDRVIAIVSPDSAPVRRIIQNAKDSGRLIDVTQGRKTMSVVFTDSEHVILSYLKPEQVTKRFEDDTEEEQNGGRQ
jgi:extracellular matrix regulatory protein A